MTVETPAPLAPQEATRLTDFARACKAAARAVMLYPAEHPAITATLGRLVYLTSPENLPQPLRMSVLADGLLLDGRAPSRPDAAVTELAAQLHGHLIGELTVHAGGDVDAWRSFLLLLGRAPDAVRAEGGISRLWTTMACGHVELREIDYAEVLRERRGGHAAAWDDIIANCLQGNSLVLDEKTIDALLAAGSDPDRMVELMAALEAKGRASGRGVGQRTAALLELLRSVLEAVEARAPDQVAPVMSNLASAAGHLSPEMLLSLLARRAPANRDGAAAGGAGGEEAPALVDAIVAGMTDETIAGFVARNAPTAGSSIDRVAQAFHALVKDNAHRERLLTLAHDEAAQAAAGDETFEGRWDNVAQKMMTSYSDKPFVSEEYARELSMARTHAVQIDELKEDPPERRSAWLGTVATTELRKLDLALLLDLLRIEPDTTHWTSMLQPVVAQIEDLLLVGDFEAAAALVAALVERTKPDAAADRRQAAMIAIDNLVSGPMMRHIVSHLATIDSAQFDQVKVMCVSLGEVLIRPLAEALSAEERPRPRERLTAILIAFGAIGRREVERLKSSPNPAVRRTAIYLLREFGGREALPELTELLDDREQQVQREAVRAILRIGSEEAYRVLEQALAGGTMQSREAIMQSLTSARDDRAAPLFSYIIEHMDHRGQLTAIYLKAIETLGALKDPDGVPALKKALYRGEWWAPRRTAALRGAAATALARIATPEAAAVLDEAAASGPRGVRSAVKPHVRMR